MVVIVRKAWQMSIGFRFNGKSNIIFAEDEKNGKVGYFCMALKLYGQSGLTH